MSRSAAFKNGQYKMRASTRDCPAFPCSLSPPLSPPQLSPGPSLGARLRVSPRAWIYGRNANSPELSAGTIPEGDGKDGNGPEQMCPNGTLLERAKVLTGQI